MIKRVVVSKWAGKCLAKSPKHVSEKFQEWLEMVEELGLDETRKIKGFHDEPLRGKLAGLRSIRLSRSYRAYYRLEADVAEFVFVERVDKHAY